VCIEMCRSMRCGWVAWANLPGFCLSPLAVLLALLHDLLWGHVLTSLLKPLCRLALWHTGIAGVNWHVCRGIYRLGVGHSTCVHSGCVTFKYACSWCCASSAVLSICSCIAWRLPALQSLPAHSMYVSMCMHCAWMLHFLVCALPQLSKRRMQQSAIMWLLPPFAAAQQGWALPSRGSAGACFLTNSSSLASPLRTAGRQGTACGHVTADSCITAIGI
jgi:hypothetical protein